MLLLVSGASGAGKSTVRALVAPRLGSTVEAVELRDVGPAEPITVARRQRATEAAAARAAALLASGQHVLLCGDPVAAGEAVAAPSALRSGGVAVCLLDVAPEAQRIRLARRGDPDELLPLHLEFARWMREHASDPLARLGALTEHAATGMRWERLTAASAGERWHQARIDATDRTPSEVAADVETWVRSALDDRSLVMHPEDWGPSVR